MGEGGEEKLLDMDNRVATVSVGELEEGIWGINGDGQRCDLGC